MITPNSTADTNSYQEDMMGTWGDKDPPSRGPARHRKETGRHRKGNCSAWLLAWLLFMAMLAGTLIAAWLTAFVFA